jgi:hypothetical protein
MAAGKKTGGRKRGIPNKASAAKAKAIADSGLTPLDYMLNLMRDDQADSTRRDWAAGASAPYVHPKLANIEHSGKGGGPIILRLDSLDARA